jgi:uncharacterized damage-inducible protein DinB
MRKLALLVLCLSAAVPAFSQAELKATVLKHLKTSEDFTVKVAEAMPEADYSFKLTPPQMSFGEQMVHLSQGFGYILGQLSGEKPNADQKKPTSKQDIVSLIHSSYEHAIAAVSQVTPDQLTKSYKGEEGTMSGSDMLLMALDHATHHRASAEMYLRAKGITPPSYEF